MKRPEIIADLQKLYNGGVSVSGWAGDAGEETVRHFSKKMNIAEEVVLNDIALDTARGFLAGELTWEFGDWVANKCLFSGITNFGLSGGTVDAPELWWEVYLAFDHSETVSENTAEVARDELLEVFSSRGLDLTQSPHPSHLA
ncbi:hypothetical protein INR77_10765 [Erythrobacter sp. SCSIO 43205]|uniref:hypothetical protein n=1 Tax=Erythrobacter sp. SCSIO 43205 TaxID=2779361 RepID=UPI001CA808C3|nr:hypothetical protein [Erythrobacter sp. SCSIO 43205]UAB77293.1 hypothetical protein INR77_10765 [Erythrobacter sp. SCSIO 43205]